MNFSSSVTSAPIIAGADEDFQHNTIDDMLSSKEASEAAQEIANLLNRPVKVDYRHQFWTGEGFEAPHRSQIFNPGDWPSPLTIENVAGWLWSSMGLPVHGYAILRAFKINQ